MGPAEFLYYSDILSVGDEGLRSDGLVQTELKVGPVAFRARLPSDNRIDGRRELC